MFRKDCLIFLAVVVVVVGFWFNSYRVDRDFVEGQVVNLSNLKAFPNLLGAESFCEDDSGIIFTGLSDGNIVKIDPNTDEVEVILRLGDDSPLCGTPKGRNICGRPLGLALTNKLENKASGSDSSGSPSTELLVCDASSSGRGLMVVDYHNRTKRILLSEVDGIPIIYCNDVVVLDDGLIILSQSTTQYEIDETIKLLLSGRATGRILVYDPKTNSASVLANNLHFPNGIVPHPNGMSLLYAETSSRLIKSLGTRVRGEALADAIRNKSVLKTVIYKVLRFVPDNLKINPSNGNLIIASPGPPCILFDMSYSIPIFGKVLELLAPNSFFELMNDAKVEHDTAIFEMEINSRNILKSYRCLDGRLGNLSEGYVTKDGKSMWLGTYSDHRHAWRANLNTQLT